jgi:glucokinase
MKSVNCIGLLRLIREHGPISRSELARIGDLSKPTVSSQVAALLQRRWVVEQGPEKSAGGVGKKPTLLRFNADNGHLIAVEIGATEIRVALADLNGSIRDRLSMAAGSGQYDHVMAKARRGIRTLLKRSQRRDFALIGVAAPGRVDSARGLVLDAGNLFRWSNAPVGEQLERWFGIPAFVDNDANMAALGEFHYGVAKGIQDFVLVSLHTGIGCGVVIRGELYRGSCWAAGEIAHMVLNLSKAHTDWNPRGYLELSVGLDQIEVRLRKVAEESGELHALLQRKRELPALLDSAKLVSPETKSILEDVTLHLGVALANLVAAYDPSLLVLRGEMFRLVFDDVRELLRTTIPWFSRVVLSSLGEDSVLLGTTMAARRCAHDRIANMLMGDIR